MFLLLVVEVKKYVDDGSKKEPSQACFVVDQLEEMQKDWCRPVLVAEIDSYQVVFVDPWACYAALLVALVEDGVADQVVVTMAPVVVGQST